MVTVIVDGTSVEVYADGVRAWGTGRDFADEEQLDAVMAEVVVDHEGAPLIHAHSLVDAGFPEPEEH